MAVAPVATHSVRVRTLVVVGLVWFGMSLGLGVVWTALLWTGRRFLRAQEPYPAEPGWQKPEVVTLPGPVPLPRESADAPVPTPHA